MTGLVYGEQVRDAIHHSENDVLLIEDTSELSWSGKNPIEGLGPIGNGNPGQQGFFIHTVLAVENLLIEEGKGVPGVHNTPRSPTKVLGVLDQQYYIRPPKLGKTRRRRNTNESLETDLWRNTPNRLPIFAQTKKKIIRVCDRGADIYEVLKQTEEMGLFYVIRAKHNRVLDDKVKTGDKTTKLFEHGELQKCKSQMSIFLRGRKGKKARSVKLNMSWSEVTTRAPSRPDYKAGELPSLEYGVIRLWEDFAPGTPKDERLEWFLLTNISIKTQEDIKKVVEIYRTRWLIEEYHKALKSGMKAENLQLETVNALMAAVAVMSIVATRLIELRERVRITPNEPAGCSGLSELELKILAKYVRKELKTIRCVALAIGRLGGHLNRKSDGMPGIVTLWRGMTELLQLVEGAQIMMELSNS